MDSPPTKEVSAQRYAEVMKDHVHDPRTLSLQGWEIALLHGALRLAVTHPGTRAMCTETRMAMQRWVDWCLAVMHDFGFTREELAWLDSATTDSDRGVHLVHSELYSPVIVLSPAIQELIAEAEKDGKTVTGVRLISEGKCPRGARSVMSCMFCCQGHVTECHYPKTCEEAKCGHYNIHRDTQS